MNDYIIIDQWGRHQPGATICLGNGKEYTRQTLYKIPPPILEKLLERKQIKKVEVKKKTEKPQQKNENEKK